MWIELKGGGGARHKSLSGQASIALRESNAYENASRVRCTLDASKGRARAFASSFGFSEKERFGKIIERRVEPAKNRDAWWEEERRDLLAMRAARMA